MKISTNQKKYLYWLISIISTFIISISIYQSLGGFNEIKVVESNNNIYNIAGKDFLGEIRNDTIRMYFKEVRNLISKKVINGELCVINYREPYLKDDEIHQFIGVLLGDEISEIPPGMEVRELQSETTFKVGLGMHPIVMPNSEKVETIIQNYAQKNGFELEGYSMEMLFSDNSVMVEMFAK